MNRKRAKRIVTIMTVLLGGGTAYGVAWVTARGDDPATPDVVETAPTCHETLRLAKHRKFPGKRKQRVAVVKDACKHLVESCDLAAEPGYVCRGGLKYGPGLGGHDANGDPVTCSCGAQDKWLPPVVGVGDRPRRIATGAAFDSADGGPVGGD